MFPIQIIGILNSFLLIIFFLKKGILRQETLVAAKNYRKKTIFLCQNLGFSNFIILNFINFSDIII